MENKTYNERRRWFLLNLRAAVPTEGVCSWVAAELAKIAGALEIAPTAQTGDVRCAWCQSDLIARTEEARRYLCLDCSRELGEDELTFAEGSQSRTSWQSQESGESTQVPETATVNSERRYAIMDNDNTSTAALYPTKSGNGYKIVVNGVWYYTSKQEFNNLVTKGWRCTFRTIEADDA
jgi:hypothetical protein